MQILDEVPSFGAALGRGLGAGLGEALPKTISRGIENAKLRRYGVDLAGIEDPSFRQTLGQMGIQRGIKARSDLARLGLASSAEGAAPLGSALGAAPVEKGELGAPAKKATPAFAPLEEQMAYDESRMPSELQMLTPSQRQQEIARRYQMTLDAGGAPDIDAISSQIDAEEGRKTAMREKQKEYGQEYENALATVFKDASEETKAAIRQRGQNAIFQGKDEATVKRDAAKLASQIANAKAAAEKVLRRNVLQMAKARVSDSSRSQENIKSSAATAVKKLTDLGLVNEARQYLAEGGWYPEEREEIMNKALGSGFSEGVMAALNELPKFKKAFKDSFDPKKPIGKLSPDAYPAFKENFDRVIESDPNVNLILLRKQYEDKGVDWEAFKRAIDEAVESGKLDPSSKTFMAQQEVLNEPPLNLLGKVLYKLNLRGR